MLSSLLQRLPSVLLQSHSKTTDYFSNPLQIHQIELPRLPQASPPHPTPPYVRIRISRRGAITMRDRSKNRKPLQKGRNLSIEAIQTVQALKRAKKDDILLEHAFNFKFKRLLKFDMVAVLRELVRQNECTLALMVFEAVRKEYWYKPRVLLYNDLIKALAGNEMIQEAEQIFSMLENEPDLQPDAEGFNALLCTLVDFNITGLAMGCFRVMKVLDCMPDKSSFRKLVAHLESKGEGGLAYTVKQEAKNIFWSLEFLEESEDSNVG